MKKHLLLLACIFYMATSLATVHMVTVADFSFTPSSLTMNLGDTIMWMWQSGTHTTTSTNIPSGATKWDNNITSATLSFMYKPAVIGTYNYNCSIHPTVMIASFTVVSPAAVSALNAPALFSIFPNPTPGSTHVQFSQPWLSVSVTLVDMNGKQVARKEYSSVSEADLDLQNVPNGTYTLVARQGNDIYKQELVVAH